MRKLSSDMRIHLATGAALLAALLVGCSRPAPPAPAVPAPTVAPAPVESAPAAAPPTATSVSTSKPPAATEPALTSMTLATAPSKLSVPVDLRYQFEGDVTTGQPVTLHLAAVPRVAGSNLKVSIKEVSGIQTTASTLSAQKASASTAYRQQLSVTRLAGSPAELRVLVTMELSEGLAFGWFSVPLNAAPAARKQNPVELR